MTAQYEYVASKPPGTWPGLGLSLALTASLLALGCSGADGVNCWEAVGDQNRDGELSSLDCVGPQGVQGPAGEDGANGQHGRDGRDGLDGDDGEDGEDGEDGSDGMDGADGTDGESFLEEVEETLALIDRDSIVVVRCGDSYGSGTKLPDGRVVTAAHVVYNLNYNGLGELIPTTPYCTNAQISYVLNSETDPWVTIDLGTVSAADYEIPVEFRDLAILNDIDWTTAGEALPGIEPAFDWEPELGELSIVVGYPSHFFDTQVAVGFITSETADSIISGTFEKMWTQAFTTSAPSAGGSSGGPIFDKDGRFVGILVGGPSDDDLEVGIGIHLDF